MAFLPAKGAEPISGYRLVEKLGIGGYGEVWKATAPGGLTKAVKIIYGDMGGSRAEQELKALGRIKEVRHPFLLSLERIEIVEGQLIIVTELADGCLSDRFYECRKAGRRGIPRDELLGHLRDAADALDYMSETHSLQHLDIKPQNLLLVGNRMKVADFGLVKDLIGSSATAPGGVTPVYATPEAFDGRISRYSDQYSLAIVYQEMLTGVRPFPGTTLMQLAAQHTNSPPLLTPLPAGDRAVIARALSKVPEQRFRSCLKMVEALLACGAAAEAPVEPSRRLGVPANSPEPPADPTALSVPLTPSDDRTLGTIPRTAPSTSRPADVGATPAQRLAVATPGIPGLRPTLFLGLGGLAAAALRRLKRRLRQRFGGPAEAPIFRFLLVDTDREALRRARQGDPVEALDAAETLLLPLRPPEHYRAETKKLLRWLDRRWFYGIPRSLLTEGLRPLGRLALVDNAADVLASLHEALAEITGAEAIAQTVKTTGATMRDHTPRTFVVASPAGGTGSGMLIGMAYAVQQALGKLGLPPRGLCAVLPYATSPKPAQQEMACVNAYATASELEHFSQPNTAYPGDPDDGLIGFRGHAPFEERYLVHLGEQLTEAQAEAATDTLADYLFIDTLPGGGAFLDQLRQQTQAGSREPLAFRTFGLARLGAEGERPLDLATNLLCRRLTQKWLAGPGEAEAQFLEREAQRQAAAGGLDEAALTVHVRLAAAEVLGECPDTYFPKLIAAAAQTAGSDRPHQLLGPIDRVLNPARPAHLEEGADDPCSPFRAALRTSAEERATGLTRPLLDWLVRLVETPGKRFKAARRAAAVLVRVVTGLSDTLRDQLRLIETQRDALRRQIETERPGGLGWLGRALGGAPREQAKLLEYCHLWLREAVTGGMLTLLGAVRRELDAFLTRVGLGPPEVLKFARRFSPAVENELPANAATAPLPSGGAQREPEDGPVGPTGGLPPELVLRFDRSFQTEVLERQGGLWGTFAADLSTPPGDPAGLGQPQLEMLAEDMLIRARSAVQSTMTDLNAAQMFLQANAEPGQALSVLLAHVEAARPQLRTPDGWEHLVLALPEGPAGNTLSEMIAKALPDVPAAVVHTEDEVILCLEVSHCSVLGVLRALVGPVPVPRELAQSMMTRLDVPWALPELEPVE
jgi:serine/threonine protein kinase